MTPDLTASQLLGLIVAALLLQAVVVTGVAIRRGAKARDAGPEPEPSDESTTSATRTPAAWTGTRAWRVRERRMEDEAASQCSFLLEPLDGCAPPPFKPGQFLTFVLDLADPRAANGRRTVTRCYSLSNGPGHDHYRVTIKRVAAPPDHPDWPAGQVSGHFHDHVQVGDVLQVRAPSGHFHLDEEADLPVVLIAGGIGEDVTRLSSTEIFDPTSAKWEVSGNLNIARRDHTATLLPNGKVLVVGGIGATGQGILSSAELFDPATGQWSATSNLATARTQHTATLLPNGKVLIAAGSGGTNSYLAGTELYDPGTNTWSGSGSLTTARGTFTATLLPSGKVLAVGGYGVSGTGVGSIASTELYDPATGTWSIAGNMVTGRYFQTATLLANGRLLVAGGNSYNSSIPNSSTYAVNAELYDPGLGYADSRRPVVAAAGGVLARKGAVLSLTGTQLTGDSEGSGGATNNSAGNLPIVQLRRLEGDIDIAVAPAAMSATAYTSQPLGLLPVGTYRLTVFSNGVPSVASLVNVGKSINLVPIISLLLD